MFLPESPKFLISKKRYEEARLAIRYIAKINKYKGDDLDFKFDREIEDMKDKRFNSNVNTSTIVTVYQTFDEKNDSVTNSP